MRRLVTSLAGLALALAATGQTRAQTAPAPPDQTPPPAQTPPAQPAGSSTTVQGVTVTGEQGGFKSSIDRKSYDLTKDLQVQAGASVADALRNLPGVNVDMQGNVSIRGDGNVVIMVDGKPSSLYAGPGAAQALQTLPADQFERAEVLTNPSAQYSPNGSAGIINLITRKSHKPVSSGSARTMIGTSGHWRLGVTGNYVAGPLSLNLSAGEAQNVLRGGLTSTRSGFDGTGAPTFSSLETENLINTQTFKFTTGGVDYDLDPKTRLSASLHYFNGNQIGNGPAPVSEDDGAGVPVLVQDRIEHNGFPIVDEGADLSYRRTFNGDQHDLTLSVSNERFTLHGFQNYADVNIVPTSPDSFDSFLFDSDTNTTTVKLDYERPMPKGGQWKAGYELDDDNDQYDNAGFQGAASPAGPLDPAQTDRFHFDRTIQALYSTYQQPFGKFTVLGGLRYETSRIDLNESSQHLSGRQDEGRLYPSLHLSYQIDDAQQLTASYSQRIQRPDARAYNPFQSIAGPLTIFQGNPNLKPQQTQVYELGYQYKRGQTYYLATLYYKDNREGETPVEEDLGGGVILNTEANLASSRNAGLELVASGQLIKTVTYNLSTDASWNQIDATPLGFSRRESGYSFSGHGTVSWQATPDDVYQANGFVGGRQLAAQGYSDPGGVLFLGYRHKFDPHLSLFVTGLDVLNSGRFRGVVDTSVLHVDTLLQFRQRALLAGFTYSFGGAVKHDPQFDFGNGNSPH